MGGNSIPITVLGGYLGAGKTTLLNRLLADPGGRRLGVIVNDFGSLAVDVDLLADAGADGVVSLPNGCVCCSLGSDLYDALRSLAATRPVPDHIVIEASGVADPAVAAGWGTSAGFEPGGVIVVAAADAVRQQATDRYVGGEVRRQLAGADLLVVSKRDRCSAADLETLDRWLADEAPGVPRVEAVDGDVPPDVVLGLRPDVVQPSASGDHTHQYVTWSLSGGPVDPAVLAALLDDPPEGLLRLKGVAEHPDGTHVTVQLVGATRYARGQTPTVTRAGTRLVAIGLRGVLDVDALDRRFR